MFTKVWANSVRADDPKVILLLVCAFSSRGIPIRLAGLARYPVRGRRDPRFLAVKEPVREHCLLLESLDIRATPASVWPEGWRWPADPLLHGFPVTVIVCWSP